MTSRHTNPAIYAGLIGAAAGFTPTYAQALELMGHEVPTSDPTFTFAAGCVVGALVAGCGSLVVSRVVATRAARNEVENALRGAHAGSRASAPVRETAQSDAQPRVSATQAWEQTGDIRVQQPAASAYAAPASDPEPVRDAIEDAWSAWEAGAKQSSDYLDVAEGYVRTRTFAERMSARAKGVSALLSERLGASRMEGLPIIARADGSVGDVGESWWDEAMSAQARPRGASFADMQSVSDQLADNSAVLFTAQTPAEAEAARKVWREGVGASEDSAASASAATSQPQAAQQPQATPAPAASAAAANVAPAAAPASAAGAGTRPSRAELASRLANPAEAFPEKKPSYTEEQQDLWAVALAALDERYEEQVAMGPEPQIATEVAPVAVAADLDEPDNLEANTAFLPFKPQGGRPDVVDTESYVDMLVDQELARNESASVRRLAHHKLRDYFKVIDGTGDIKGARHLAAQQA